MNTTKRSVARAGLLACSVLAVALTGCRTEVIHENTRTVYAPAPPPVVNVPPAPAPQPLPQVVYAPPAPQPPLPVVFEPPPEEAPIVVIQSENDFYEPLAAYGRWVVVGSYGRCWIPARVETGWRPYSNGYWQRTDAGWYWTSDEPWGWATYHYGRWDFHADYGWIWVPQTQWAPAWVSWREGGGYVGWAPLRPSVAISANVRVGDHEPAFDSRAYVFVEHRRMLEPVRPKTVIVNNTIVINKTVNITQVTVVNKTVINEGPRPEVIERESGRQVRAVPVHELRHQEEATVLARERNIPRAPEKKAEPPARTLRQSTEKSTVLSPVAHHVDKPNDDATQPAKPLAAPVRPTSLETEKESPARDEKKRETEVGRIAGTAAQSVEPQLKPGLKPEKAVVPRRQDRPVEKPEGVAKPTPQTVTEFPAGLEKKRETAIQRKDQTTPPTVEPKPGQGFRPEAPRETNSPAKVQTTPPSAVKKQTAQPLEKPADKHQISLSGKLRTADQVEANKKKKDDDNQYKQGGVQETPTPGDSTRQPR